MSLPWQNLTYVDTDDKEIVRLVDPKEHST